MNDSVELSMREYGLLSSNGFPRKGVGFERYPVTRLLDLFSNISQRGFLDDLNHQQEQSLLEAIINGYTLKEPKFKLYLDDTTWDFNDDRTQAAYKSENGKWRVCFADNFYKDATFKYIFTDDDIKDAPAWVKALTKIYVDK